MSVGSITPSSQTSEVVCQTLAFLSACSANFSFSILSFSSSIALFNDDAETDGVVIIGEIGGTMEVDAARWIKENCDKPIVGFIAGQTAPPGRRMGHAGAIVSGGDETAEAKMKILGECGIEVCKTVADIGKNMKKILEGVHNGQ